MLANKVEASINLDYKSDDDEEVGLEIMMDGQSAQLNVMLDGTYYAHVYINEKLELQIQFAELIGDKERRKDTKINLPALLEAIKSGDSMGPSNDELNLAIKQLLIAGYRFRSR
jgi:hypothetical protein